MIRAWTRLASLATVAAIAAAFAVASLTGTAGGQEDGPGGRSGASPVGAYSDEVRTSAGGVRYVPGELVVAKQDGTTEVVNVEDGLSYAGLKDRARQLGTGRLRGAEAVDVNTVYSVGFTPNDDHWPQQSNMRQIGAPGAWDDATGSGVRVCVIDTGYDRRNTDLDDKVVNERDILNGESIADDGNGHGTHVAGIAAAETNNGAKVAGAGRDARLLIAKAGNAAGELSSGDIRAAVNWCVNNSAAVINMSFVGPGYNAVVDGAVQNANAAGVVVVAAAGNGGGTTDGYYPVNYDGVVGVSATNPDGSWASYSKRGSAVDLAAPGTNVLSTDLGNGVRYESGTSMAAPHVSGAAALIRSKGQGRADTINRLFNTAEDRGAAGKDPYWGRGFLNANCAVSPGEAGC